MEKFPAKIRAARERLGRTQKDLAEDLGTAQPRVSDWEEGKRTPNLKWILRIARALDVTADYLLDDALDQPQPRAEIGPEEQKVLWAFRISGLSADDVGSAIMAARGHAAPAKPVGRGLTHIAHQDLTELRLGAERAARRASRPKGPKERRSDENEGGGAVPTKRRR